MLPFGQGVLLWRVHRGLTQAALATRAHLPQPNLSAIERGSREVSLKTIRALALALDVTPGTLVDGIGPIPKSNWTRERMERVAKATVEGDILNDAEDQRVAEALASLVRSRRRASGHSHPGGPRRHKRRTERAWLSLSAHYPPTLIQSLLQRVTERLQKLS